MFLAATATVPSAATRPLAPRADEHLVTVAGSGSSAQVERRLTAAGSAAAGVTLASPTRRAAAPGEGPRVPFAHRSSGPAPKCIDESTTDPTLAMARIALRPGATRWTEPRRRGPFVTRSRVLDASPRPGGR